MSGFSLEVTLLRACLVLFLASACSGRSGPALHDAGGDAPVSADAPGDAVVSGDTLDVQVADDGSDGGSDGGGDADAGGGSDAPCSVTCALPPADGVPPVRAAVINQCDVDAGDLPYPALCDVTYVYDHCLPSGCVYKNGGGGLNAGPIVCCAQPH